MGIEEILSGIAWKRQIDSLLNSNVKITDISNQSVKLVGLKADDKVAVGYVRDKSQRTTLFKVIG